GLSGREDLGAALTGYQRDRDAATAAGYDWTLVSTAFVPDSETSRNFIGTVARDSELSKMFVNLNPALTEFRTVFGLAIERAAAL
ncbi:MAG: hypothetical protein M3O87_04055, partial [Candidatus Dormibacteraeota bacterium]|nr:hypothetical protein [Candidatus Dormibacteraeota bacterium]